MKILITGGLGFIGTHLKKELESRGHDVEVLDIIPSPDSIRCDVSEFRQVQDVFENWEFDLVYHLAAEFGRHNGEVYYETLWKTNVIGTKNIVTMQNRKHFRCVYFSSSEVYGNYPGKMHEEVVPGRLLNDYAVSKWANEQQVLNSRSAETSIIIRPFNVYGPGETIHRFRSVYSQFIYKLLQGEPITVFKGHRRTSICIYDFVRTVANIANSQYLNFRIYNIGYNQSHTIERLAEICLKHTKADKNLVKYINSTEAMTTIDKKIDIKRAIDDLSHVCATPLYNGIKLTTLWMRANYGL